MASKLWMTYCLGNIRDEGKTQNSLHCTRKSVVNIFLCLVYSVFLFQSITWCIWQICKFCVPIWFWTDTWGCMWLRKTKSFESWSICKKYAGYVLKHFLEFIHEWKKQRIYSVRFILRDNVKLKEFWGKMFLLFLHHYVRVIEFY